MRVLIFSIWLYILLFFLNPNLFWKAVNASAAILLKVLPIMVLVFILMLLVNLFVDRKKLMKIRRGWLFAVVGGILSTGPIYLWYPLLAELRKKGLTYGQIACFLYNRAIKLPLIPLMIAYFGWKYTVTLLLVMVFASLVQGIIIDRVMA